MIYHQRIFRLTESLSRSTEVVCYPGPSHIDRQRKSKRRCVGIHPYPVLFKSPVEILAGVEHEIILQFHNCDDVETVWGGGGSETVTTAEAGQFHFRNLVEPSRARSSVFSGQIPVIYFS